MHYATFAVAILILSFFSPALADTITTQDGQSIEGVYVREINAFYYAANPNTGKVQVFYKDKVTLKLSDDRESLREAYNTKSKREGTDRVIEYLKKKQTADANENAEENGKKKVPEHRVVRGEAKKSVSNPLMDLYNLEYYLANGYSPARDRLRKQRSLVDNYVSIPKRPRHVEQLWSSMANMRLGIAENGDYWNMDNDGDGRTENVHVNGYYRSDGTYVRGHYRASPRY